ncbi:MAG: LytTR family DNA-binding domain-containing protein [Bacteroidota bacterium]
MNEIKAIIIDDEHGCVDTLSLLLSEYHKDIKVLATANSVETGLESIRKHNGNIDVLFLDIQMPGGDGFTLLQQLEDISFKIVFTTAYDRFALKAIKYAAFDYLLKPIDNDELTETLTRVRDQHQHSSVPVNQFIQFKNALRQKTVFDKLAIPTLSDILFIPIADILYLNSDNNYTTIHLSNKQQILSSKNLGYYEDVLDEQSFFRVHNSYIVNIRKIAKFIKGKASYVEIENGLRIEVSMRRRNSLLEILGL